MSQEFSQDFTESQDFRNGGNTLGFTSGSICPDTSLYKATDGKVEFIELIDAGSAFPPFPGGNGTKKCTWSRLTLASDGNNTSFQSVKVEAGTL